MFSIPPKYFYVTVYALLLGVLGSVFLSVTNTNQKTLVTQSLVEHIASSRSTLTSLTTLTSRNDADEEIKGILKDCPMRGEYETMLSHLNSLSAFQMQQAVGLYDACGDFYALRKRLMVTKVQSALESMTVFIDMYKEYTHSSRYDSYLATWKPILAMEIERKELLSEQTVLQGDIMRNLAKGTVSQVQTQILRAQEIEQSLDVKARQLEDLQKTESSRWDALSL